MIMFIDPRYAMRGEAQLSQLGKLGRAAERRSFHRNIVSLATMALFGRQTQSAVVEHDQFSPHLEEPA
jgi:hypothetical protein